MHPELLNRTVQACREYMEAGDCHGEAPPTERLIDAVVQLAGRLQESDFNPDWSLLKATQGSLRENMALGRALRDALAELLECKALKDAAEAIHFAGPLSEHGENWKAEYDRMRTEYTRRQPLAWEAARKALATVGVPFHTVSLSSADAESLEKRRFEVTAVVTDGVAPSQAPSGFGPFTAAQRKDMVPEDKSRPVFWCGNCGARNQLEAEGVTLPADAQHVDKRLADAARRFFAAWCADDADAQHAALNDIAEALDTEKTADGVRGTSEGVKR